MSADATFRFAPSPTGLLHLGHAYSALFAWDRACATGGRFLLRIEDIDTTRVRPDYEAAIYDDLTWLGLAWERPVLRQSDHGATYRRALDHLTALGLTYLCFKTRSELARDLLSAPHGPQSAYVGAPLSPDEEAEKLADGAPYAVRLSLSKAKAFLGAHWTALGFEERGLGPAGETGWIGARPERLGDIVLARKELGLAYHLCVVVDDARQGVTEVTRGCDLQDATHIQVVLQALLGLPRPTYRHHGLLMGEDGKRLAKRNGAPALRDLRLAGAHVSDVRALMAHRVGVGCSPR